MSNSGRKEAMDAKVMSTKLKEKVYDFSSLTTPANTSINKLKTSVNSAKKSVDTTIRNSAPSQISDNPVRTLGTKRLYP